MDDQELSIKKLKDICVFKEDDSLDQRIERLRELRRLATLCGISCKEGGFHLHISHAIDMLSKLVVVMDNELHNLCLHIGCQFISNLATSHRDTCSYIWLSHSKDLKALFMSGSCKMKNSLGLFFINALNYCKDDFVKEVLNDESLFTQICEEATNDSECLKLFIERLLSSGDLHTLYEEINKQCLYRLLSLVEDAISINLIQLSDVEIHFILDKFKFMSQHILNNSKEISPGEFQCVLGVVTALSSNEHSLLVLQSDISFAIDCIYSLKAIHGCEKAGTASANSGIDCYKRSLVRIIGNLCWEKRVIQDLVRHNHCIPVILECCKIDLSNPFINEWSVFAIRNLCKDNIQNQQVIAAIKPNADLTHLLQGKIVQSLNKP